MSDSNDTVVICRCEDITREEIQRLIARGYRTVEEIKRVSRCGMGPCQGRTCLPLIMQELARSQGRPLAEIAPARQRPPAAPVSLGALARGDRP